MLIYATGIREKGVNQQHIKVLLVEDEPAYAGMLREILAGSSSSRFELVHVERFAQAQERLTSGGIDVVLLDLTLPDRQGLETYADAHAMAPAVPIIVLTGFDDEQLALQAVREGAQDYLVKGQLEGKMLSRIILHAIERKRGAEALRQSEEFFRLISENVSDLIAVIDRQGKRLYNSPSYGKLLGDPARLIGTDSFDEVHPEDREGVKQIFHRTLVTGTGSRAEYRMVLKDGSVRFIESQGSAIRDENGVFSKVVVVSRDITERREAVTVLRQALSDLKHSHEELTTAQLQLIHAEKLEAVSTFAGGVAHEVKNPLQTIILGVDYLASHLSKGDATAALVLADMGSAVMRADGIIRGLLEFSATKHREIKEEDLSAIVEQSLRAVEHEIVNFRVALIKDLPSGLGPVRFDARTMKHVFIHLFMHAMRELPEGGKLVVQTFNRILKEDFKLNGKPSAIFKMGEALVGAAVETSPGALVGESASSAHLAATATQPITKESGLGLTVLRKIIELYGGVVDVTNNKDKGSRYVILFKPDRNEG